MKEKKQMRLVTKVVIGFGILLVFVISLSWYNDQGLLISYAGSRPDIPITINIDNSLNLEDQRADLLVKMQDAANEYGCPENKGSNNALGTVEDDFEQGDEFVLKVANVGCKDGTDSRLYIAVYGVPLVKRINYIGSSSENAIEIYVDRSLFSDSAKNYLRAKMQVAINKHGCPENGGTDSFLRDIDTLHVEDDFAIELAYIKCKDDTNNGVFFKVYPHTSPTIFTSRDPIGGLPIPGSILALPLEISIDKSLSIEDRKLEIISQKQVLSDKLGCQQGNNYGFETVLGESEVLEEGDGFTLEVDKIGCQDGTTQILFFKVFRRSYDFR